MESTGAAVTPARPSREREGGEHTPVDLGDEHPAGGEPAALELGEAVEGDRIAFLGEADHEFFLRWGGSGEFWFHGHRTGLGLGA